MTVDELRAVNETFKAYRDKLLRLTVLLDNATQNSYLLYNINMTCLAKLSAILENLFDDPSKAEVTEELRQFRKYLEQVALRSEDLLKNVNTTLEERARDA